MKKMEVTSCCWCPFNEHGQHWEKMEDSKGKMVDMPGPPKLYCMYDPDESLRDNGRGMGWRDFERTIWIAGKPEYEGEFEKQLSGFPDWCPLNNDNIVDILKKRCKSGIRRISRRFKK